MKKEKLTKTINIILFLVFLVLIFFSKFINEYFSDMSFEQLLYNITDTKGANYSIVFTGVIFVFLRVIFVVLIIYVLYRLWRLVRTKVLAKLKFKEKPINLEIFRMTLFKKILILSVFILFSLIYSSNLLNLDNFVKSQLSSSKLFEDYYVDAKDVKLKFPKKKRNLIYIYLESMETSNTSIENGGLQKKSYIPKLEKLALENINFSNTDKLGGAFQINNTNWTMAALISHTSGVPLKLSMEINESKDYGDTLPGVYNLGDILKDNGYNNYFMIGSDAEFGGRKEYFERHGNYTIYDYYYAIDEKYIDADYHVWWGYEDKKLFKYAKEKILDTSKLDEPFNFTILTVDTHFTDGYMDDSCDEIFEDTYANAIHCSDSKIYSFVKWLKKQDFYEDTTIIITGDHLTMQKDFYDNNNDYQRTIYNTFINSPVAPKKEKNRLFSSFDMFPTTLASLGVEIEGNKLGLGVNLFSKEETLIEKFGYDYFNNEITKKSDYYNNKLLKNINYKTKEE